MWELSAVVANKSLQSCFIIARRKHASKTQNPSPEKIIKNSLAKAWLIVSLSSSLLYAKELLFLPNNYRKHMNYSHSDMLLHYCEHGHWYIFKVDPALSCCLNTRTPIVWLSAAENIYVPMPCFLFYLYIKNCRAQFFWRTICFFIKYNFVLTRPLHSPCFTYH